MERSEIREWIDRVTVIAKDPDAVARAQGLAMPSVARMERSGMRDRHRDPDGQSPDFAKLIRATLANCDVERP
jgi:hypothetical protein